MKIFVDTNVLIDYLEEGRQDFAVHRIVAECQLKTIQGFISVLSIPNILYIERHAFHGAQRELIAKSLLATFDAISLTPADLSYPFVYNFRDYEDGLQTAAAIRANADYIITKNLKDFQNSPIPAITPKDFFQNIIVFPKSPTELSPHNRTLLH